MKASLEQGSPPPLTRAQGQAFQQRWQAGPEAEAEEWGTRPLPEKICRLAGLMPSGQQLGMTEALGRATWMDLGGSGHTPAQS